AELTCDLAHVASARGRRLEVETDDVEPLLEHELRRESAVEAARDQGQRADRGHRWESSVRGERTAPNEASTVSSGSRACQASSSARAGTSPWPIEVKPLCSARFVLTPPRPVTGSFRPQR